MAFFKFRRGADEPAQAPPAESIEAVRRRAMHRLIGSAALVLAAVIGFPLLFDNQPRPIAVDIPIEIPDKNKGRVTAPPAAAVAPPAATVEIAKEVALPPKADIKVAEKAVEKAAEAVVSKASVLEPKEEILTPPKKQPDAAKPAAPVAIKPPPESSKPSSSGNAVNDSAKAQALLDGKSIDKNVATVEERFVVQVGAFSDLARAKEARTKLERAGLKTYTQVVETKDGPRTRVRVGPFGAKAEADNAAQKIKTLDLPATVLVL